jgi:antitoxin VapB
MRYLWVRNHGRRRLIMRKDGELLILEPTRPKSLLAVLATLKKLEEDFPPISELPLNSTDL